MKPTISHGRRVAWARRALVAVAATAVGFGGAGCSSDDDGDDDAIASDLTIPDMSGTPGVVSRLVSEGEHRCEDEPGDVTISALVQAPPPVEMPELDLLEAHSTLDDAWFTTTFTVVGEPDPDRTPQYLVFVGLLDDSRGFEVQVVSRNGLWFAELIERADRINRPRPLASATVTVEGSTVRLEVPVEDLPPIAPNLPVNYGTSGPVRDADGTLLDDRGDPVGGPAADAPEGPDTEGLDTDSIGGAETDGTDADGTDTDAGAGGTPAVAFDDCITFGQ